MTGLDARALAAWAGTARLSALDPARLAARPLVPASAALALFVAGVDVPAAWVRVPALLEPYVERRGDQLHARISVLPTTRGVIACDRADAPTDDAQLVCWPDDSSYHLARSIPPGRRDSWLDLGCGSAFAALERPELAARIVATDLNPRAVEYANLGAALSGVRQLAAATADLDAPDPAERFALVTCNAPIPGGGETAIWRATDAGFVARLVARSRDRTAPGGLVVIHAAHDALAAALAGVPGDVSIAVYTPAAAPRAFAVGWWAPDAADRRTDTHRDLTVDRPHLDHLDR